MSGTLNKDGIIVRKGDSFCIKLHFTDEQGDIDLTGAAIKMSVADDNGVIYISKQGVISDVSRGMASIELLPQDTNIEVGNYLTDIQITFADGQVHTIYPQNVNTLAYFRVTAHITE